MKNCAETPGHNVKNACTAQQHWARERGLLRLRGGLWLLCIPSMWESYLPCSSFSAWTLPLHKVLLCTCILGYLKLVSARFAATANSDLICTEAVVCNGSLRKSDLLLEQVLEQTTYKMFFVLFIRVPDLRRQWGSWSLSRWLVVQPPRSPNDIVSTRRLFSFSIDEVSSFYAVRKFGWVNYSHVNGGDNKYLYITFFNKINL